MPDGIAVTPGVGATVKTDLVGTDHYQVIKIDAGGDGVAVPIVAGQQTKAASLPVVLASDQGALPVSDNSSTLSVDDGGGALTVDGTVAITAAALPLPSGAATSALQGLGFPAAYLGAHASTDGHVTIGAIQYGEAEAGGTGGMLASNKRGNKL